jgi:hypothetical protein
MSNPELKFRLDDLKKVVQKWLCLESLQVLDVIVGTYIANRFPADPLWMIIIGPPSSAKTEIMRAFEGHKYSKFISNLTPSTMASGILPKNGRPDPSLLPQLNDKLVVLKDFTTVLSMRSEQQAEILAQLRETYDGQYSKIFGNGKEVNWRGRYGLLAACTPVYDKHYSVIGSMGERFLIYRTDPVNGGMTGTHAQKLVGQEETMRKEIREALHKFIDQFERLDGVGMGKDEAVNLKIINLACFVAIGRCAVDRDRYSQALQYTPMPEGTPRLVKQFMQIGAGIALANGRVIIDDDVYQVLKKIGRDLISTQRLRVLDYLWREGVFEADDVWDNTPRIANAVNLPGQTAKMTLEDLMVVGALKRQRGDSGDLGGQRPYQWQIADDMADYIHAAEVFDA